MKNKPESQYKIAIIGGGLSGLAAAYFAQAAGLNYIVIEKEKEPGGLCRSHYAEGFVFDYTGHLLHFSNEFAENFVLKLLKNKLSTRRRNSFISYKKKFIPYPFQYNLSSLPEIEKTECFTDFLDAYFKKKINYDNFEKWSLSYFGRGISKYFMLPYNSKLFKYNLKQIRTDWFGRYMPQPDFREMLNSIDSEKNQYRGYNSLFYYPAHSGINLLTKNLSNRIKTLFCSMPVHKINPQKKWIETAAQKIHYEILINTAPLPEFIEMLEPSIKEREYCINNLEYTSVFNMNYGLETNIENNMHWIYFPEQKYEFYRTGFYHNFSSQMTPCGKQSAYIEVSYRNNNKIDLEFLKKIRTQFLNFGKYSKRNTKIILDFPLDIKYAYVIYNKQRAAILENLNFYFKKNNIHNAGRYAEWNYSSMQDSILSAYKIMNSIK